LLALLLPLPFPFLCLPFPYLWFAIGKARKRVSKARQEEWEGVLFPFLWKTGVSLPSGGCFACVAREGKGRETAREEVTLVLIKQLH